VPASLGGSGPERANQNGRVSLMITQTQKEMLRGMGVSEEEIRNMTPAQAHEKLGTMG
jgi:hypothetical protein